jgi:hypothetical protein
LVPPERIEADGRIHRCDVDARNEEGDGAYLLHLDGIAAGGFENWQNGGWQDWCAKDARALKSNRDQLLDYLQRRLYEEISLLLRPAGTPSALVALGYRNAEVLMQCHEPVLRQRLLEKRTLNGASVCREDGSEARIGADALRQLHAPPEIEQFSRSDILAWLSDYFGVSCPTSQSDRKLGVTTYPSATNCLTIAPASIC